MFHQPEWVGLFSADGLHFNKASEFVATVGDIATKIKVLGLRQGEMRQLAVLQSQDMQKSWADLEARVDTEARPRLREWKEKQKGERRLPLMSAGSISCAWASTVPSLCDIAAIALVAVLW